MGERVNKIFYAIFIAIVVLCGAVYAFFYASNRDDDADHVVQTEASTQIKTEEKALIYVQLCGAIKAEGVYEVPENTRVFEVVEIAGGLTEDASNSYVNQARLIKDGEMIYFPTTEEVSTKQLTDGKTSLININLASVEELMTLPGIGESRAKSIIDYRDEHNGFQSIEEIMSIDGIKEAMYEKIKDLITI